VRLSESERKAVAFWHALPEGWQDLPYQEFLVRRRRGIAAVIRKAFEQLR
jgi:hypothetical protein